jgi:hypothetical protein
MKQAGSLFILNPPGRAVNAGSVGGAGTTSGLPLIRPERALPLWNPANDAVAEDSCQGKRIIMCAVFPLPVEKRI